MARKFKITQITGTVEGAYEGAKSEVESLKEEMDGWRDNLEDTLSHTSKYEEVSECCDNLETAFDELGYVDEFPDGVGDRQVTYPQYSPYGRKPEPRWMRMSNAQHMVTAVKDALADASAELDEVEDDEGEGESVEDRKNKIGELVGYLEDAESAMEACTFPGMY